MPSIDEDKFELDEPAAKTHTPPGWPIRTIEIKPSGKAPKHYGPRTYRFGAALTLSVILPRRGWTLVKRNKNYAYLTPPADQQPPFHITIAIPTPEECLAITRRCYARGVSWQGQLGEFPAWYLHERNVDMRKMWRDPTTGEMQSETQHYPPVSSLTVGEWGVWEIEIRGEHGQFALPPSATSGQPSVASTESATLTEGGVRTVELTAYERNPAARLACLQHYGQICQACGLKYEDKYGAIGADLIHVHHITPLASIGKEYQVDPIRDLVPLCATCHHVVHQRSPPYTVAEIRAAIAAKSGKLT